MICVLVIGKMYIPYRAIQYYMSDNMSEQECSKCEREIENIVFGMECDVVQRCISRMATTASWVKCYTCLVGIGGILTTLVVADARLLLPFIAAVFVFCGMDAYYLRMERMFRRAYDSIIEDYLSDCSIRPKHHSMNPYDYAYGVAPFWRVAMSKSVLPFYGMMVTSMVALAVILLI